MADSPHFGLKRTSDGSASAEKYFNENCNKLEMLTAGGRYTVKDRLATPPALGTEGARYLIIATATGDWAGKEDQVAADYNGEWVYHTPVAYEQVKVENEAGALYDYNSGWALSTEGDTARIEVFNNTGAALNAGDVVYISGWNATNEVPEVSKADADDSAKMPAIGIVDATINDQAVGTIPEHGVVENMDTAGMAVGDALYVDTTAGAFTNTRPTVDAIQKIGLVLKVAGGGNGALFIVGAGRSNDVPIAPSFTDFTNANHDHADADSGGAIHADGLPINDAGPAATDELYSSSKIAAELLNKMTDPTTTQGDLIIRTASAPNRLGKGNKGQILEVDEAGPLKISWQSRKGWAFKTIESPGASEDKTVFFTNQAITITEMRAVLKGGFTPSVTWTVRHSTDRSAAGNEVVTSGTTTTSETTGSDVTSFNDATIPADSFVWIETTASTGGTDELHVSLHFTYDTLP